MFDNHIQKHLYCTNEERRRNNKAIEEEERGEGPQTGTERRREVVSGTGREVRG